MTAKYLPQEKETVVALNVLVEGGGDKFTYKNPLNSSTL